MLQKQKNIGMPIKAKSMLMKETSHKDKIEINKLKYCLKPMG